MSPFADDKPGLEAPDLLSEIAVDRAAEVPIGVQLAWALRSRIADGRLQAGARLPALRELADGSGVNVNTVRAVYQRLEQEGLIESLQGSGTFVCGHAERATIVGNIAALAASEAQSHGVDPRSVAAALYTGAATTVSAADEALARRHSLRAQVAALERTVTELESGRPGLVRKERAGARQRGPRLLDTDALEGVRSELLRRLVALQESFDGNEPAENDRAGGRVPAAAAGSAGGARGARRAERKPEKARQTKSKPARGRGLPPASRPATA